MKIGVRKHVFVCYDNYPSIWINGTYREDIEQAHLKLRNEYKNVFEQHREFINKVEQI